MNKNELREFLYHSISIKWLTVASHKVAVKLDKIRILCTSLKNVFSFNSQCLSSQLYVIKIYFLKSVQKINYYNIYFTFAEFPCLPVLYLIFSSLKRYSLINIADFHEIINYLFSFFNILKMFALIQFPKMLTLTQKLVENFLQKKLMNAILKQL